MRRRSVDESRFWKIDDFGGMELLKTKSSKRVSPRHWHDTYNIDVVVKGEHQLEHEGATHEAGPGCIFLFNPGEIHTTRLEHSPSVAHRTMYPTEMFIKQIMSELIPERSVTPSFSNPVVYDVELARLFSRAHTLYEQGIERLRAHSMLLTAFSKTVQRYTGYSQSLPEPGKEPCGMARAVQFIYEAYTRDITLDEIAAVSGLSTFYFLRSFRRATGLTPCALVINLRIEKAKELLRNRCKIADVATNTGFYDQSHLTNYFKSIVGVTPRQYACAFRK